MNRSDKIYELTKISQDVITNIIEGYLYPDYKQQYEYVIWQSKIYIRDSGNSRYRMKDNNLKPNGYSKTTFYRSFYETTETGKHYPIWPEKRRDYLLLDIQNKYGNERYNYE